MSSEWACTHKHRQTRINIGKHVKTWLLDTHGFAETYVIDVDPRHEVKSRIEAFGALAHRKQVLLSLRAGGTIAQLGPSHIVAFRALFRYKKAIVMIRLPYFVTGFALRKLIF